MATYPLPRTVMVPVHPVGLTVGTTAAPSARTLISVLLALNWNFGLGSVVIATLFVAPETVAVTVAFSIAEIWDEAVAVNENEDELPGMFTEAGTVKFAEVLVNVADSPATGAAGERLPTQDVL